MLGALAAAGFGLGFLPLFGGPGYEAALALGLLLPLPVACASAWLAWPGEARPVRSPLATLASGVRFATLVLVSQLALLLLHGLRVGFCDPLQGIALFGLGPAAGVMLAAAWGTVAGLVAGHVRGAGRGVALALAALGPLGGVLVSGLRFLSSPMVFAFDPFAGFFAGTLYDTVIDAVPRLVTYRAGSAGTLLGVGSLCAVLARSARGRLRLKPVARHCGWWALALAGGALSMGISAYGPELGHYHTSDSIRRALGHEWASARCDIVYASGITPRRVELLGEECDGHIAHHEAYFGTQLDGRITVFLFASAAQKGALMGASRTYIAKPWRREVYVQNDDYPHGVLAHELAHVVAGAFARGPLRVAGPLNGWIPDPGRIEGFAVAAAPPEDTDYSLLEWTRALRDLGLLPSLRRVFRLSFLAENASTGYTVAGAAVHFLHERYGSAPLRAWYAGESVEAAFGKGLSALEGEFNEALDAVEVSDRVREIARVRFDRPAIFGRRCPHVVDRLLAQAAAAFKRYDIDGAARRYLEGLELDPSNFVARLGLAACEQRRGDDAEAAARYERMANDETLTLVQRAVAIEKLADRALLRGDLDTAGRLYEQIEEFAFDEHRGRAIDVKRHALLGDGRQAIVDLLIGDPTRGSDLMQASARLGEWAGGAPASGLPDYLIGKNLYSRGRVPEALSYLRRALERGLPLASVRREALRLGVYGHCALRERQAARQALREYLADPGLSPARKSGMQRFAELCGLPGAT